MNIPHGRFRNRRWGYRLLHTRSGYVVLLNKERKTQSQINKTFSYSLFLFDEYLVCRLQFVAAVGGYHIHSSWEGKSQAVAIQRAIVVAFTVNARDRQPVQPVPGNYFTLPLPTTTCMPLPVASSIPDIPTESIVSHSLPAPHSRYKSGTAKSHLYNHTHI